MDDLLQYMAVDLDEPTRKVALSLDGFCCDDELTTMRSVTTLANWVDSPKEPRYSVVELSRPVQPVQLGENED